MRFRSTRILPVPTDSTSPNPHDKHALPDATLYTSRVRDLLIPLSVMSALSILAACAGALIGLKHRRLATLLAIVALLLLLLHATVWGDSLLVARVLPVADAVIYGNIQPLAAGLLGGLAWSLLRTPKW